MRNLELGALAIVVLFVFVRARFGREPRSFLIRISLLVVASWIAEDTVIRAYGFYFYNPDWSVFIDKVPLAILLIWPIVIHSAWELAAALLGEGHRLVPLVGAAFVWADASLIEPIAVGSGLWQWTEPGLFEVPPIGILGWAFHAGLCMWVFEWQRANARSFTWSAVALALTPIGTHLLLLASWWLLFRWINHTVPPWPVVACVWIISLSLTAQSIRSAARRKVPALDIHSRAPAAAFFFVLLALDSRQVPALIGYALAFAPPYLSLARAALDGSRQSGAEVLP
jgi:hypothetical protein